MIQGLTTLLDNLSSWAAITDGPAGADDALPDAATLEQLNEVKWAWEKARDSVRAALETVESLTSEPAQQVASIRRRPAFKLWMKSLVCFS